MTLLTEHLFADTGENSSIALLKQHFPQCSDKDGLFLPDKLAEQLQTANVPVSREYYTMNWLGKSYARYLCDCPPITLLGEDSAHNTQSQNQHSQNLLIKGDNLEVLKHLKNAYANQVKMIYIDPPYNTGSDGFVYQDDRKFTPDELAKLADMSTDEARRVLDFTAKKSNSHSAWLTFMYPRLYIARELLKEDGVIFISIDDNEQAQLKLLCDEVFGEENFVGCIIIDGTPKNDPYIVSTSHEYVLAYAKIFDKAKSWEYGITNPLYEKIIEIHKQNAGNYQKIEAELKNFYQKNKLMKDNLSNYKFADNKGVYRTGPIDDPQNSGAQDLRLNPKTGSYCKTPNRGWSCTLDTWNEWLEQGLIEFPDNNDVSPSKKTYITEDRLDLLRSYIKIQTRKSTTHLKGLFGTEITPFANPKPLDLLKNFIANTNDKNAIYLDFFAGSGSFAEAIFKQNIADNGARKFILVQIDEIIEVKGTGKARKIAEAAFNFVKVEMKKAIPTIFDITKARIEKAAQKIKSENPDYQGDLGFKIFETMPDFRATDDEISPQLEFPEMLHANLEPKQYETLLTTWCVYDGNALTQSVQSVELGGYSANLCGTTLYVVYPDFDSVAIKALLDKLDHDADFIIERIVLFGEMVESAKQRELKQALDTYNNKKNVHLSLLVRY
ncbi:MULTISPECIES: site-specific DNA-methyltransferase [Moraxella]|uniref:site-specific DNA-methyltransferase (adenine-specific) n=1 Tax=Moraxella catarrhalis TaxID=480 RepID=A0A7Z1A380_MORCA|nr:DNA methyltransferase [Moraxella catarrhalis]OAU99113.1 Type III restriction-modification system methylation subunit [Moraxella catarrhalis]STY82830.1 putative methyltransferase [Moraxella catarrhalis]